MERFIRAILKVSGSNSSKILVGSGLFFFFMFLLHIYLSFSCGNFNWFGALLTVYSFLFTFGHSVYPQFLEESKSVAIEQHGRWVHLSLINGGMASIITKESAKDLNSKHASKVTRKYGYIVISYVFSIFGTLLWAYSGFIRLSH